MRTYLERYQSGEHESVWNELVLLGAAVRQEPVYADALAVAREIMRRVRQNIEELIDRLIQRNFVFGYDHRVQPVFRGTYPAEQRKEYLEMFAWAREQPPVFVASRQREEERLETAVLSDFSFAGEEPGDVLSEGEDEDTHTMSYYIDEIEQLVGTVPLSMRAWYEEVGGVNFYGYHAEWDQCYRSWYPPILKHTVSSRLMSECDPLMVYPLDKVFMMRLRREYKGGGNPIVLSLLKTVTLKITATARAAPMPLPFLMLARIVCCIALPSTSLSPLSNTCAPASCVGEGFPAWNTGRQQYQKMM